MSFPVTDPDPRCARCHELKGLHRDMAMAGGLVCPPRDPAGTEISFFRRGIADMPRLGVAPDHEVPCGSYVHVKSGGRYEVLGGVFLASGEDDVVMVLYQAEGSGYLACRPIEEFSEKFSRCP